MPDTAKFTTADAAVAFMTAGNATVTLVSTKTGNRFTYKFRKAEDTPTIFISLLNGPDNESDYRYLGRLADRLWIGRRTPKPGDISPEAPSAKALAWVWERLNRNELPDVLEIWHEGRCGRCNRKLTVPASIASGIGPECAQKSGLAQMQADWTS